MTPLICRYRLTVLWVTCVSYLAAAWSTIEAIR